MTKKIFIGALVAITFAGTVTAMAQSAGAFGGGKGGRSGGGDGGGYSLGSPATHAYRPTYRGKYRRLRGCGCIVAVVKNSEGNLARRSCNKPAHFNDQIIGYECGRNK